MTPVQSLCTKPLFSKFFRHNRRAFQQPIHPNPRKTTERHLQTAGPIDPERIGILRVPVPPLPKYLVRVTPIFGKPICLGQSNQVLMTVQLPRDFAIPNLGEVEIADLVKRPSGSLFPMHRVKMPIE